MAHDGVGGARSSEVTGHYHKFKFRGSYGFAPFPQHEAEPTYEVVFTHFQWNFTHVQRTKLDPLQKSNQPQLLGYRFAVSRRLDGKNLEKSFWR